MIKEYWLNIGSLVFGLIAWIIPLFYIIKHNKSNLIKGLTSSVVSLGSCIISLGMHIFYTNHLVKIEDWSALIDTSNATVFCSTCLIVVTIILNIISLIIYYRKKQ